MQAMAMYTSDDNDKQENLLMNIRRFIGKNDPGEPDSQLSLLERSQCSVLLLRSLPTVRSAVLEQIGNVFEELAHKYIVEAERHLLAGQHVLSDVKDTDLNDLVSSVQATLSEFVETNSSAWAPQIVKWSIGVLGKICGQYGIYREFSKLNIDGRLQLWMNCSATRLLLEISVGCFSKVMKESPDIAVEDLLQTACENNPYFDWVLVHFCCCFPDIVPIKMLSLALEEFSMQARNAEVTINLAMRVFNKMVKQYGETLEQSVLNLFKTSVSDIERTKEQNHIADCTIPFLLHVGKLCPVLVDRTVDRFLDILVPDTLRVLKLQAERRDKVLQKGMSTRILDLISKLNSGSFHVLQFLLNFACGVDIDPAVGPELLLDVKKTCCEILESLSVKLHTHVRLRHSKLQKKDTVGQSQGEEFIVESPILKDLQQYSKQLCSQFLDANGTRQKTLGQFLILCGIHGGNDKMVDIMTHALTITRSSVNVRFVVNLQLEFEVYCENVLQEAVTKIVSSMKLGGQQLGRSQLCGLLVTFKIIMEEEQKKQFSSRERLVDCIQKEWKSLTHLLNVNEPELSDAALDILEELKIPGTEQQVSDIFVMANVLMEFYFSCVKTLLTGPDNKNIMLLFRRNESLLFEIIKTNLILQQSMIRIFIENVLAIEELKNGQSKNFAITRDVNEESLNSEHKQLLDENISPDIISRLPANTVSVMYAGTLNKNRKRKIDEGESSSESKEYLTQCLYNFLVALLAPETGILRAEEDTERSKLFVDVWFDRKTGPRFPSSHAFLASLLTEIICPDVHPMLPWPDEEFLKYTIERNLRIKRHFDKSPLLWKCLELISIARPALCHCSTIIQSLFAYCLMYWQVDRNLKSTASLQQLKLTQRIFELMDQAGWLPHPISSVSDIFEFIKPKEIYHIMSRIWKFCVDNSFVVEKFNARDQFGQPCISFHPDVVNQLREMLRQIFYDNIETLGVFYSRYMTVEDNLK